MRDDLLMVGTWPNQRNAWQRGRVLGMCLYCRPPHGEDEEGQLAAQLYITAKVIQEALESATASPIEHRLLSTGRGYIPLLFCGNHERGRPEAERGSYCLASYG